MNLVILHPHILYPGGASKYMLEVASRIAQKGLMITVVLTKYDRELIEPYRKINFIEVGKFDTGDIRFWLTFPIFFLRLKNILDRMENKILFPQIFPPVWWAALYKFFSPKTPIVWMCQEPSAFIHSPLVIQSLKRPGRTFATLFNPFLKFVDKYLVKKVDYIIANSRYGQKLIKEIYGRQADIYAYPSVDTQKYRPTGKKENYVFTISRLDKQKNIDLLIKAFSSLPSEVLQKFKLLIGGEGTERKNLEKIVENLQLSEKVTFLGRIKEEELPSYYAGARLTVFLGEFEPFGIIPVESMSCGTPVVALKKGGVIESIVDGQTGVLLNKKDEKLLAEYMLALLENKTRLRNMSKAARENIIQNFSWDITADKIYQFIRKRQKWIF